MKKALLLTLITSFIAVLSNGQTVQLYHYTSTGVDNGSTAVTPCTNQTYYVSVSNMNPSDQVCFINWQWTFAGSSTVHSVSSSSTSITINVTANMTLSAMPLTGTISEGCGTVYNSSTASLTQAVTAQSVSWSSSNVLATCGSSQTYSINPINCAVSYNYYLGPTSSGAYFTGTSNAQSLLATTATSVGVTFPAGSGSILLSVSPNYADGTTGTEALVSYTYGLPPLTVAVSKIVGITAFIYTQNYAGYNYSWTVNGLPPNGGATQSFCNTELTCGKANPIQVVATSACGTTSATGSAYVACNGGGPLSITPNPSYGVTKVSIPADESTDKESNGSKIKAVQILDLSGKIVRKFEFGSGITEASINTAGLTPNIYILHIYNGKEWTHKEIIVKNP